MNINNNISVMHVIVIQGLPGVRQADDDEAACAKYIKY